MTAKDLEIAAIQAHSASMTWADFWPTVAGDLAALGLDYCARGQFVHRLVGLVVSGDVDGQRAAGDFQPWQVDEPPAYPASDDRTVARLLWQPGQEAQP